MNTDAINSKTQVNNQQKKYCLLYLNYILYQSKKSADVNKYEQPTVTLTTTFLKPVVESNVYVCFGYYPQTIFYHTCGQVSGSMNVEMINSNKQVNNQ